MSINESMPDFLSDQDSQNLIKEKVDPETLMIDVKKDDLFKA